MRGAFARGRWVTVALAVLATAAAAQTPPPWTRTETRAPCAAATPFRAPFYGDLHVHTYWSADAYIFGTRTAPRDAYAFARGQSIPVCDDAEGQTRTAQIDRPLDFAAVTDHSEFIGEVRLCVLPTSGVYDNDMCQVLRLAEPDDGGMTEFLSTIRWLFLAGISAPAKSHTFCNLPGVDCDASAASVWQDHQAAAEEAYDRTDACGFTTFVGYESTPSPTGRHLHRNVIFRNSTVPHLPASFLETWPGGTPEGVWDAIERDCIGAGTGCDAVVIPHNSNLSGGLQFGDPADGAAALRRQTMEPLVELHQQKGNSECRFDRVAGIGSGTADELCTFEQDPDAHQGPDEGPPAIADYPSRNMVRNALKDGLGFEETLGANPFRFGFIGSTDTHNATAGAVAEVDWPGGQGRHDASARTQLGEGFRTNPGGLAVVWAEENSRDALFAGLRRRETYATSGTRPVVRFFAGALDGVECGSPTFVADAYATGTPMGGEMGAVLGRRSPRFAVWAMKDAGTAASPGTDLQRIQIVKGWVDEQGQTHEKVVDVAGSATNGAGVDRATCAPTGAGSAELCAVWTDPEFRRTERAFYYARVLENPTCRWSTRVCRAAGVDPFAADCAAQAAAAGDAYADCCRDATNDSFVDPIVQERAWTSPVWYRPEAISRLDAKVRFGARGTALGLRATLGGLPKKLRPNREALTIRVADDDDIVAATLPAGALHAAGAGRWVASARAARAAGLRRLTLTKGRRGVVLAFETRGDLAHADRSTHFVTVEVQLGTFRTTHTRLWTLSRNRLEPEAP